MVTDNHSSHKSRETILHATEKGIQWKFLPAYSSTLSVVERVWSMFKARFAKYLNTVMIDVGPEILDIIICDVLQVVKKEIRPTILNCTR